MYDFLLELLVEDIPSRFLEKAESDMADVWAKLCKDSHLPCQNLKTYVTPRRLVLTCQFPEHATEQHMNERGPRVDTPPLAHQKFAEKWGVTVEQLIEDKGYMFARGTKPALSTNDLLKSLIPLWIRKLPWPQTMTWGSSTFTFVRPLRNVMVLWRDLSFEFEKLQTTTHTWTQGPYQGTRVPIQSLAHYHETLQAWGVKLACFDRRQSCVQQLPSDVTPKTKQRLEYADHLTLGAENPYLYRGELPPEAQDIPLELLDEVIKDQGNVIRDDHGYFFYVTEGPKKDPELITKNYRRLLQAKIMDAVFYHKQDQQHSLEDWAQRTDALPWVEGLGTYQDKRTRMKMVLNMVAQKTSMTPSLVVHLERALRLWFADRSTHVGREYPALQGGTLRAYHAQASHEDSAVVRMFEHDNIWGHLLRLLEYVDTLAGYASLDRLPRGSSDPLGLRAVAKNLYEEARRIHTLCTQDTDQCDLRTLSLGGKDPLVPLFSTALGLFQTTQACEERLVRFLADRLTAEHPSYEGAMAQALIQQAHCYPLGHVHDDLRRWIQWAESSAGQDFYEICNRTEGLWAQHHMVISSPFDLQSASEEEAHLFHEMKTWGAVTASGLDEMLPLWERVSVPLIRFFEHYVIDDPDPLKKNNRLLILSLFRSHFSSCIDFTTWKQGVKRSHN